MKRNLVDKLIKWNTTDTGKPILLTGAKGVGKTYLAYDFAKAFFKRIHYVNFERELGKEDSLIQVLSDRNMNYHNLRKLFQLEEETSESDHLLILDEISFTTDFTHLLHELQRSGIFPKIICISSNPMMLSTLETFELLPVYPMEFDEFLLATANEWYIEMIKNHFESNKKIPDIVHKELLALFHLYLQIGGMPGVINEYQNLNSIINIPEQHEKIISIYHDNIMMNYLESDALKMNQVIDSIPFQLGKENKKFQFKLIRKGTTFSMFKVAIDNLTDCNYILRCNKISSEQLLSIHNTYYSSEWLYNETNFKIYMADIGLLYTKMMGKMSYPLPDCPQYKGILENYVAQSLHSHGYQLGFWESNSMAKIDFLMLKDNELIPIEIHTSDNTRSKSINVIRSKYEAPYAIKVSSKNFDYSNQIKFVPYYSVFCL